VRTTSAKLVQYPGHAEWTELFELPQDRYETNNLVNQPGSRRLHDQLLAEFERQVEATGYHEPALADKPGAAGDAPGAGKDKKKMRQQP